MVIEFYLDVFDEFDFDFEILGWKVHYLGRIL